MTADRRPDPNCPRCHGSGVIDLAAPFLDRVDESTVPCPCTLENAVDPSEEDTLVVKDSD
jgi:hypothetical protein